MNIVLIIFFHRKMVRSYKLKIVLEQEWIVLVPIIGHPNW